MGIETDLRHYIVWPLAGCMVFPMLYGAANLFRGFFAGAHRTGMLGRSTILKSSYLVLFWLATLVVDLPVPGIALAIFLLLSAESIEAYFLYRQRRHLLATGQVAL